MKKNFEVLPPEMPNFVSLKKEAGLRQDGFKVDNCFDIADFTQQEAEEFADLMHQTFMEHYIKRRNQKSALREITE